jgi:hypothetical protein
MIKLKYIFISTIILMIFCQKSEAQNKSIKVLDQQTKRPIKYAYLFFIDRNDAVNCDENGNFAFTADNNFNDSLTVSAQGYYTQKLRYQTSDADKIIALTRNNSVGHHDIHMKIPTGKQLILKPYKENQVFNFTGLPSYLYHPRYQIIAQKFELPSSPAVINKLTLSRLILAVDGITEDKLTQTRFRIRFFYPDSVSGAPGQEITSSTIEIVDQRNKTIEVTLPKNEVVIGKKIFFVGIEYLRIPYNLQFSRVNSDGSAYDVDPFSKTVTRIYQPFIGMDPDNRSGNNKNIWIRDFGGKWEIYDRFSPDLENLAIKLEIKID